MSDSEQEKENKSLVSFIHFTRKIQNCDGHQLSNWIKEIANTFDENNECNLFKQILIAGTQPYYKQISSKTYQGIEQNAPKTIKINDSLSINDSKDDEENDEENDDDITDNNDDIDKRINCPILAIPKDLLWFSLNYASFADIVSLSKTCRYLFIASNNSNCIYQIKLKKVFDNNQIINHYQQQKFSKIKSLIMDARHFQYIKFKSISTKWNRLKQLTIDGVCNDYHGSNAATFHEYFTYLTHLMTFTLNMHCQQNHISTFSKSILNFIQTGINPSMLQSLYLNVPLTNDIFIAINKCINLKELSLFIYRGQLTINNKLFANIKPFKLLTYLETDSSFFESLHGQNLFKWLLINSPNNKTVKLEFHSYPTNDIKLLMKTLLLNIKKLIYSLSVVNINSHSAKFLVELAKIVEENHNFSLDCFELHLLNMNTEIYDYMTGNNLSTKCDDAIQVLLKHSKYSRLIHYNFEQYIAWYDNMNIFFNSINVKLSNQREIEDEPEYTVQYDIKRVFNALEFLLNMNKDEKIKLNNIGVQNIGLTVEHDHCYNFDESFECGDWENADHLKRVQIEANVSAKKKSQEGIQRGLEKFKEALKNAACSYSDDGSLFTLNCKINID